jgi:hypothetical protein
MNQKMVELLGEHADKYPKHLEERFLRIFNKLLELWGTPEMIPYLDDLVMSDRPDRAGFPVEVAAELWNLSKVYPLLHPDAAPAQGVSFFGDIWNLDGDVGRHSWGQKTDTEKDKSK